MPLFGKFWKKWSGDNDDDSSGDEVEDKSAEELSYVGTAAYNVLRRHYNHYHHELWNVTKGKVVGELQFTPRDAFARPNNATDPPANHDDWFPERIGQLIAETEQWCDIMSLAPPDGLFLKSFQDALYQIVTRDDGAHLGRITIRMMFGNIVGMPVDCNKLIAELTKNLPKDVAQSKLKLWVGSWRKGVSWNHAKIIAIDGKHLWTGGHNFWDYHYLKHNPTNDLSMEIIGGPARDAHLYANGQWGYIVKKQSTAWGQFVDKHVADVLDVPRRARVTVSEYPGNNTAEFPPYYKMQQKRTLRRGPQLQKSSNENEDSSSFVPMITMGRYGVLLKKARPSDAAIVAMLESAQTIIKLAIQDIGPVVLPGTKLALPGLVWPKEYLNALAKVLWERGVDIEIVLSNPNSIPGGLSATEANYGNGWTCIDVAAEIIKAIQTLYPDATDAELRVKVRENLRVCYLRSPKGRHYADGKTLGLHSKHFIIDDICCYVGSQNLYICDLAEWGVVIDHPEQVEELMQQYWYPMWKVSFTNEDADVDEVMDALKIDRVAATTNDLTPEQKEQAKQAMRASEGVPANSTFHSGNNNHDDTGDASDNESESEGEGSDDGNDNDGDNKAKDETA